MVGRVMMDWFLTVINITGSTIIRMNLLEAKIMLMELKVFGVILKEDY
jgi:hypothetical protein